VADSRRKEILSFDFTVLLHNGGFCNGCKYSKYSPHKYSFHKKIDIIQKMNNNTLVFTFYFHLFNNEQAFTFDDIFVELCKHRSMMQLLQNPPSCIGTDFTLA
jgi:hypothetical protein